MPDDEMDFSIFEIDPEDMKDLVEPANDFWAHALINTAEREELDALVDIMSRVHRQHPTVQ